MLNTTNRHAGAGRHSRLSSAMGRRTFVGGVFALMVGPPTLAAQNAIADIERKNGGRLGVFVTDTHSGRSLAHRETERFLMCSTFKGPLVALILQRVDRGSENLSRPIAFGSRDLIGYSPVTSANVKRGVMSVEALGAAAMLYSDNTAAVLLMKSSGGPAALTAFFRRLGDNVSRSDRYEIASNYWDGVFDTTSPKAMAGNAGAMLAGNTLSRSSRQKLQNWMAACQTGTDRLRAAFPPRWVAGDRTGTGDAQANDYAFIEIPGRAPLLAAAYYDAPGLTDGARNAVLRQVGAAIVDWAG